MASGTSVMASETQLMMISCCPEDEGTQRCFTGASVLESLKLIMGDAVSVRISPEGSVLCTVWPQMDCDDCFLQLDNSVASSHSTLKFDFAGKSIPVYCISKCSSCLLNTIDVTVIINDVAKVPIYNKYDSPKNKLGQNVCALLRHMIVAKGFTIGCSEQRLGKLFGIQYVLVEDSEPSDAQCGQVTSKTTVNVVKVMSLEKYEQIYSGKRPANLGGVEGPRRTLKELLELCYKNKELADKLRVQISRGILLCGPPGCGKTSLVKQVVYECEAHFVCVNGFELHGSRPGETEENLRGLFQRGRLLSQEGLCVLFVDELDSLCSSKEKGIRDKQVLSQLCSLLDDLSCDRSHHVMFIGATNRPSAIDDLLRRPGRLEKDIMIGVPNIQERESILQVLVTKICLHPDVSISELAASTPGYVGADLKSLVQQATYKALKENNFEDALHHITPSTQRGSDILVDHRPVLWEDIGGLDDVKMQIKQAVEWPLLHPEAFARMGVARPKGVLLYGPPGCAKTTLVRAAATACHVTFLAVSMAQLYSPFVGDSERRITEIFQQARAGAPCILFFDEVDALVGSRSQGEGRVGGVQERVLSTLLNQMDGVGLRSDELIRSTAVPQKVAAGDTELEASASSEFDVVDNTDVLVVAATNRPDMLDDALLRPGRLDKLVYVPPPDCKARLQILRVHSRSTPLHEDVDLEVLAQRTEGYTGADLENLCREAALHALSVDGIDATCISQSHFDHILSTIKPSLSMQDLKKYAQLKHLRK